MSSEAEAQIHLGLLDLDVILGLCDINLGKSQKYEQFWNSLRH